MAVCVYVAVCVAVCARVDVRALQAFTATFTAYSKLGNGTVTGVLYKAPAPHGGWDVRAQATTAAAGGTQTTRITVVNGHGVAETLSSQHGGVVRTDCAQPERVPSLAAVVQATESAVVISRDDVVALVGDGACHEDGLTRVSVLLGEVYEVNDATLAQLDTLECHPDWYRRQLTDIEGDEPAWIYLMEDEAQCAAIRGDPTRFPAVAVPGDWRSHLGRTAGP